MILRNELFEIGVINKTHGIDGELSVTFRFNDDRFENIDKFIVEIDGIFVPFFIEEMRFKNDITALVLLDGISSEIEARQFLNKKIFCLKTFLGDSDENLYDSESLIGFTIKDENGETIGDIEEIDDSTENYLFIVNHDGKDVYIPIADEFIVDIDDDKKIITMNLPEGIISL